MQAIQKLKLDLNENVNYKYVYGIQFDNASRFVIISLTENGVRFYPPQKATASFRCLKPDGTSCINAATINSDGTITAELTNQVLAVEGTVKADISLLNGKSVLSTATFFIQVEAVPSSANQITSTNEFLILDEKINEATEAINAITDTVDTANEALQRVETIESYIGYTENDILGLQVDFENKKFTRLAGAVELNAGTDFNKFNMYGGRKRCAVAKDGTINAFYGDTDYKDAGSANNGQIMVYQPKFYYKVVPLKMDKITDGLGYHIRKANYYISDMPKSGFKLHPAFYDENGNEVDYILYSAYEGCYWDSSMQTYFNDGTMDDAEIDFARDSINSISGKKPISGAIKNLTTTNLELLAQNLGHGWHLETIKTLSANQLLMMIELGTMNVQNAIGKGVVSFQSNAAYNASSLTGSTSTLGNTTGAAAKTINEIAGIKTEYTEDGKVSISYRGIENLWGNLYKHINGINIWGDGTMLGGQPYIAGDFNFDATKHTENYSPAGFTLPNGAGYISAMGYGSEKYDWLFMPSEIKGNSSLPVGDYTETFSDVNGYRSVSQGGAYYNNLAAGIFNCYCAALANGKGRTFGGRIIYIPTAE